MPYIVVNVASGHPAQTKREMLANLSREVCQVLEVGLDDTLAYAAEFEPDDVCAGGEIPSAKGSALVTIVMSRGRPPAVLLKLIEVATDVVERALRLPRRAIHCVLEENEASNVAVAGAPLSFPRMPRWLFDREASRD